VGKVSWLNLRRKGIEGFVRSARFLPTTEFQVIGPWMDDSIEYLKQIASKNVTFRTNVDDSELVETYRQARVVVQASYHEGFGCALAEAMTFGCVPVVTRRGALPEVVGDTGYYVEYGRLEDLASAIALAMNDEKKARLASERAKRLFTINERQRHLFKLMERAMMET
jgi:glycosyltransferase involved in cell wall biosynthesis